MVFRKIADEPLDMYSIIRSPDSDSDGVARSNVCGHGVFTKLRLLPKGGTKEERAFLNPNHSGRFIKRKNKQLHSGSPFDLSPLENGRRDLGQTGMSDETSSSSSYHSFQARSHASGGERIAQFEAHNTLEIDNDINNLSSMEDSCHGGHQRTPRASNSTPKQHFDEYMEEPPQHQMFPRDPSPDFFTSHSSILSSVEEVALDEEYNGFMNQSFPLDSIISCKESCDDGEQNPTTVDNQSNEERMVTAMKDMILLQQGNLQTLADKNEMYRDRLSASHERVVDLRQEQLDQKDKIIKLQFEREAFEAEAIWLREELLALKNQVKAIQNEKAGPKAEMNEVLPPVASSEIRWTRAQQYVVNRKTFDGLEEALEAISPRVRSETTGTAPRPALRIITDVDPMPQTVQSSPEKMNANASPRSVRLVVTGANPSPETGSASSALSSDTRNAPQSVRRFGAERDPLPSSDHLSPELINAAKSINSRCGVSSLRIKTDVDLLTEPVPASPARESFASPKVTAASGLSPRSPKYTETRFANIQKTTFSPKSNQDSSRTTFRIIPHVPQKTTVMDESEADSRYARAQMKVLAMIKEDIKSKDPLAFEKIQNGPLGDRDSSAKVTIVSNVAKNDDIEMRVMKLHTSLVKMQLEIFSPDKGVVGNHDRNYGHQDSMSTNVAPASKPLDVHYRLTGGRKLSFDGTDNSI
jgi:hypothetical protein